MYKTRIHQWGLDKKLKEHEARAIIHMHARRRGKATRMRLRDLPVDIEKAYSYFKRKGITIDDVLDSDAVMLPDLAYETHTASPTPMPLALIPSISPHSTVLELQNLMMMAGPQGLGSPRAFRAVEMLFVDAREYLLGSIHFKHDHIHPRELSRGLNSAQIVSVSFWEACNVFHPDQKVQARDSTAKVDSNLEPIIEDISCEAILLMIEWIANLLKRQQRQQKSRAWLLCKQLHYTATNSEFREHPIISVLGRMFSTIGFLLLEADAPDYLPAIVHIFIDSLKTIVGPVHILTVSATISLSRVMCSLYGPKGLLKPLETLRTSLEEQHGWGMEQSAAILAEMVALNFRSGYHQVAQKLAGEHKAAIFSRARAIDRANLSHFLIRDLY
ncbi:MAG: hypothetical protein Q9195_001664 [Heterodermia aff. obscurata]